MKNPLDLASVVLLPALWAGSFVLQRQLSPFMGSFNMAFWRLVIASLTLILVVQLLRIRMDWRQHWRAYFIGGLMTTAIPWAMVAFGSRHLPAAYLSIISSSIPLWAALSGALLLGERITRPVVVGLCSGMAGIWVITWHDGPSGQASGYFLLALAGVLGSAMITGMNGVWIKRISANTQNQALCCGTMITAALFLSPSQLVPAPQPVTTAMLWQLLMLGVVCSALAQLLFFRLLVRVTTAQALATSYLNPAFTALWAWLFLGEPVTWRIVAGSILVLGGTSLITFGKAVSAGKNKQAS